MILDDTHLPIIDRALDNLLKKPLCPAHKFQAKELKLQIKFYNAGVDRC